MTTSETTQFEAFYRTMRLIRRFEESVVELVNANEIPGVTHEYIGQEAVATGVCAALEATDVLTSTHRGHGHLIARGADVRRMMAELFARTSGLNQGRGGSMHIADLTLGIYGANGIVAAGVPIAAGAAWSAKHRGEQRVAVAFFGDGAINQGVLYETMNLAGVWRLPIVFVCENNQYAVSTRTSELSTSSIRDRAAGMAIRAERLDGMSVLAVFDAASKAVEHARAGNGPTLLECETYRFVGHHTAEHVLGLSYREDGEIDEWRRRDPLAHGTSIADSRRGELDIEVDQLLDEAIAFARNSDLPDGDDAFQFAYATQIADLPERGWWDGPHAVPPGTS